MHMHFGQTDSYGSEHSISGILFPGEIQIVGYNSDLYSSFEEAATKKRLKITEYEPGKIDIQAMFDNINKPRELTFYRVMMKSLENNANKRFERDAPPASSACCLRAPQAAR